MVYPRCIKELGWRRLGVVFCCVLSLMGAVTGCSGFVDVTGDKAGESTLYMPSTRIRGLDPARAPDVSTIRAVARVYEGLLEYDYKARPYRLRPLLAVDMPTVSEDGLVYTFHIREGIFFQDDPCFTNSGGRGRELTAHDFVYSIKRVADVRTESSGYWVFNDRILGLDEFRAATLHDPETPVDWPVEGLVAVDDHTLRITLKQPYPQLLWILTMPYAYAVPREAVEYYGGQFVNHPVGTGPYILKTWRRNYRIEFVRNPAWQRSGRMTEEIGRLSDDALKARLTALPPEEQRFPCLDRIVGLVIGDPSTRWLAFMQGQLDIYTDISRDNWDVIISPESGLAPALYDKGIRLDSIPGLDTHYIGFNMDDPVLGKNSRLRQALTCAFNSGEWVDYYNGRIVRAKGPIPPGVAGYDEKAALFPFDLDRARELLAAAGYPDGTDPATGRRLELTLELGRTDTDMRESTELLISFMAQLGVVIHPVYNNKPALFKKIEKRQAQMFRLSWYADYPDAENFLQLFYSPNSSPGPNRVNYSNPAFDRLYQQVRTMQDTPERTAQYRDMADIVIGDAPWIFMHHTVNFTLRHTWLRNYQPHDFPYGMEKYYWIEGR
ncbi:MAG: hypothetical protein EOM20_08805 [Spartobacteria bacterium]|nr:hypothetical protein [Spartobacteria bacterium]